MITGPVSRPVRCTPGPGPAASGVFLTVFTRLTCRCTLILVHQTTHAKDTAEPQRRLERSINLGPVSFTLLLCPVGVARHRRCCLCSDSMFLERRCDMDGMLRPSRRPGGESPRRRNAAAPHCGASMKQRPATERAAQQAIWRRGYLRLMNADERSLAKLPNLFLGRERLAREVEQTRARRVLALVDARRAHHDAHSAREGVGRAAGRRVGLK